jgi:kynurenine formamidase
MATTKISGNIVDLTLTLEDNMPAHRLFQRPVIIPHHTHENTKDFGLGVPNDPMTFATTHISTIDHIGTHIDAFFHVNPDGLPVDQMPLDMFMGKAVCLDLQHIPDLGDVDVGDIEEAQKKAGVEIDGHIVLMCSGLTKRHYPNPECVISNWGLTEDATHWLADRNSKIHGVEGPSTDRPNWSEFPSHRVCRERGITHYEWLVNMEQLLGVGEFFFSGVPLKVSGGSGSPVRAFAVLN